MIACIFLCLEIRRFMEHQTNDLLHGPHGFAGEMS
jgi:hypothetical protein